MTRQLLTLGPVRLRRTPAGRLRLSCRGCRTAQYLRYTLFDSVIRAFDEFAKVHEGCAASLVDETAHTED